MVYINYDETIEIDSRSRWYDVTALTLGLRTIERLRLRYPKYRKEAYDILHSLSDTAPFSRDVRFPDGELYITIARGNWSSIVEILSSVIILNQKRSWLKELPVFEELVATIQDKIRRSETVFNRARFEQCYRLMWFDYAIPNGMYGGLFPVVPGGVTSFQSGAVFNHTNYMGWRPPSFGVQAGSATYNHAVPGSYNLVPNYSHDIVMRYPGPSYTSHINPVNTEKSNVVGVWNLPESSITTTDTTQGLLTRVDTTVNYATNFTSAQNNDINQAGASSSFCYGDTCMPYSQMDNMGMAHKYNAQMNRPSNLVLSEADGVEYRTYHVGYNAVYDVNRNIDRLANEVSVEITNSSLLNSSFLSNITQNMLPEGNLDTAPSGGQNYLDN